MAFDLLLPDLFPPLRDPTETPDFRLPALERWLARAQRTTEAPMGAGRWLAGRFGLTEPVPFAAIGRLGESDPLPGPLPGERENDVPSPLGEGQGGGRSWLRADPVHLAVGQDSVTLHDAAMLSIEADEARALVDALARLFRDDGLDFEVGSPERWYVRVDPAEVPRTTPLEDVVGGNVFGLLPAGTGRINWGSALTETQMLFAAHPVNAAREASGRPTVNGVWFWGEGVRPDALPRVYDAIVGGDEVVRGMARLSGAGSAMAAGTVLEVLEAPSRAMRAGDADGWRRALEEADGRLFAELDARARSHGTVRLVVPGRDATRIFTGRARSLLAWPRTPKPWTHHA